MLTGVEIRRKLVHLLGLAIPIGYNFTSKEVALLVVVPLSLLLLSVDLLRRWHGGISSIFQRYFFGTFLRESEKMSLMGSTYFLLSSSLILLLFPGRIAIPSLLILIISDTCAALVGSKIGRTRIFSKTLERSIAFFLSALLIVWLYPQTSKIPAALAALGATVVELLPLRLDDNLTIPLVAGGIMFCAGG